MAHGGNNTYTHKLHYVKTVGFKKRATENPGFVLSAKKEGGAYERFNSTFFSGQLRMLKPIDITLEEGKKPKKGVRIMVYDDVEKFCYQYDAVFTRTSLSLLNTLAGIFINDKDMSKHSLTISAYTNKGGYASMGIWFKQDDSQQDAEMGKWALTIEQMNKLITTVQANGEDVADLTKAIEYFTDKVIPKIAEKLPKQEKPEATSANTAPQANNKEEDPFAGMPEDDLPF